MAIAGRKPKPEGQARHRVPAVHDWIEVADEPYNGPAPLLPHRFLTTGDDDRQHRTRLEWPARTRRWWSVISAMPHCVLWTDADWQYALDTAEVHARFEEGKTGGTELRIREKILGTTLDARRSLRIRYVDPRPELPAQSAEVIRLDRYRDL